MIKTFTGMGPAQSGLPEFNVLNFTNATGSNYVAVIPLYATNSGVQLINYGADYVVGTTNYDTSLNNYPIVMTASNFTYFMITNFLTGKPTTFDAWVYNNGPTNLWFAAGGIYLTNY
ncbi:MAG TPA: hypothetical protein VGI03_03255 [Verrucomicrobiae bacterium]|jgi:hypothetical protein